MWLLVKKNSMRLGGQARGKQISVTLLHNNVGAGRVGVRQHKAGGPEIHYKTRMNCGIFDRKRCGIFYHKESWVN